jgi:tetratricopeptide (TPR) repeat protein
MLRLTSTRTVSRHQLRLKWSIASILFISSLALLSIHAAFAAEQSQASSTELTHARQLLHDGKYAEAYDLLSPMADASRGDPGFDYLFGRAALGTGHAEQAKELFEASIAAQPYSPPTHLALGRALFALGRYAEAKIEFETVFRFDNLPPDLLSQVEIYNEAAKQSLDEDKRLTGFAYVETGIGVYNVHDTVGTRTFGGADRNDTFYNLRAGGGFNYALDNGYALSGSLDYRFRYYDNSDSRDDSDLRWNIGGSRSFGDNNLSAGFRGRTSYRGSGNYRNDAGVYVDYRYRLDPANALDFDLLYSRRHYPSAPSSTWTRTSAIGTAGWNHSFMDGRASFTLDGRFGRYVSTTLPDGNSDLYGASASFDFTFSDTVDWGCHFWWEHNAYDDEQLHFHPDTLDNTILAQRNDNLYEIGTYLTWQFAPSWTLRPQLLWIHDRSNADIGFNYASTEFFVNVRKSF